MKEAKEQIRTSYTSNEIGSGQYCECGQEYTYDEWREVKYGRYKKCQHEDRGAL